MLFATGALADGHEGFDWLCLSDGCFELLVSGGAAECSWYQSCNVSALVQRPHGFATRVVAGDNGSTLSSHTATSTLDHATALLGKATRRRAVRATTSRPTLLIFYHVPKTAGTGLMALVGHLAEERRQDEPSEQAWPHGSHTSACTRSLCAGARI